MPIPVPRSRPSWRPASSLAAAVAITAFGVACVSASRAGISRRGWLIRDIALPLLAWRSNPTAANRRERIAADRARGPGMPSRRLRAQYEFHDESGEDRILTLAPRGGPTTAIRILYLHGGAYVFDLDVLHWKPISMFVSGTGSRVVVPIYPLAPEFTWEAGMACAERCHDRLVEEVGAQNVVIAGDSAGGGLALALTQRIRDRGGAAPAALVLFSPWLDVSVCGTDQPALAELDPMLDIEELRVAGRMWAGGTSIENPAVSPLFGDQSHLPPTMVFCGTHDLLVSDARRLAAAGGRAELREYSGMFHVWMATPIPEGTAALREAVAFINAQTANLLRPAP